MRLSKKQRHFLSALSTGTRYEGRLPLIVIHNMPESIWFSFRSEHQAYEWVRNMESRGLVSIEQDCFVRITELGMEHSKD